MKPEDKLSSEDQLKIENELLRLKLELEHGMTHLETSTLNTELENSWLNNIYNFEQQFNNAKRIKVYDAIGRPAFRNLATLSAQEVSAALKEILSVMEENRVELDRVCTYDDAVIYKFITEELFECEMDDFFKIGMTTHFTYEEFYPNHEYDLRRYSDEFIKNLLSRRWNPEFDTFLLSDTISFKGSEYNSERISPVILAFQEGRTFRLDTFEIELANFDLERGVGNVQAHLAYNAQTRDGNLSHHGPCIINFNYDSDRWCITGFKLPGLGG